jgi:hypothetical protein
MWEHQMGRIDFDEPLFELAQRGWRFREYAPIVGAQDGGCWTVIGMHGGARVQVDRSGRRDAWAEAVRVALMATTDRSPLLAAPFSETKAEPPVDLTACDEERVRLRAVGWSFSEHLTVQASGREGWVVSGTRGGRRFRVVDDDRSDAWGTALILAALAETAMCGVLAEPPSPGPPRMRHGGAQARTVRRGL